MKGAKITKSLRSYRRYHRIIGISIAIILLVSAITGVLLAWKKEVNAIQPKTQKGVSTDLAAWKPVAELAQIAQVAFTEKYPEQKDNTIERMDVRPSKGIVKVLFAKGWWEVQVDGVSGEVKSIARRHSDWIEALHDGSLISQWFKLLSMNVLGIGLLIMIATGLWLWYGPKQYRKLKRKR